MDLSRAYQVTKAFATYFELDQSGGDQSSQTPSPCRESCDSNSLRFRAHFAEPCCGMKQAGISAEDALAALGQIQITPVFTAHPTEVARQTVLLKRRRIAQQLERLDRLPLTAEDAADCEDNIRAEVTSLWQTDEVRLAKPTVNDEIRMGLRYFRLSLFDSLPKIYDEIVESFREVYGLALDESSAFRTSSTSAPGLAAIATAIHWSSRSASATLSMLARALILREYLYDVEALSDRLSSSRRQTEISADLLCAALALRTQQSRAFISPGDRTTRPKAIAAFFPYMFHRLQQSRDAKDSAGRLRKRRGIRAGHFARARQPPRQSWRTPGPDLRQLAATQDSQVWISPAHARHPPARARARTGVAGTRSRSSRASPSRRRPRTAGNFSHNRAGEAQPSGAVDSPLHHQRRGIGNGCD